MNKAIFAIFFAAILLQLAFGDKDELATEESNLSARNANEKVERKQEGGETPMAIPTRAKRQLLGGVLGGGGGGAPQGGQQGGGLLGLGVNANAGK